MLLKFAASIGASLGAYIAVLALQFVRREFLGFMRLVPGPGNAHSLYGHLKEIDKEVRLPFHPAFPVALNS